MFQYDVTVGITRSEVIIFIKRSPKTSKTSWQILKIEPGIPTSNSSQKNDELNDEKTVV